VFRIRKPKNRFLWYNIRSGMLVTSHSSAITSLKGDPSCH
jgi:hypothetical protein